MTAGPTGTGPTLAPVETLPASGIDTRHLGRTVRLPRAGGRPAHGRLLGASVWGRGPITVRLQTDGTSGQTSAVHVLHTDDPVEVW